MLLLIFTGIWEVDGSENNFRSESRQAIDRLFLFQLLLYPFVCFINQQ